MFADVVSLSALATLPAYSLVVFVGIMVASIIWAYRPTQKSRYEKIALDLINDQID